MSDRRCLIISDHTDLNAKAVGWGLKQSGIRSVWLQTGSLADEALPSMAWRMGAGSPVAGIDAVAAEQWSSVLFRRHQVPKQVKGACEEDQQFLIEQWRALQRGIWALGPEAVDALWVNAPAASARAENKLVQLQEVRHCAIAVPETLVGNDPLAIRDFVASHPRTVYKPFIPYSWDVDGRHLQTPARLLPVDCSLDSRSLSLCPGIYQACIDKRADWRVTVIGKRVYSARITAHANSDEIDWRPNLMLGGRTRCEVGELPASVSAELHKLMDRLGLVYGAIDLVEDLDGRFWFLEINQVGQFLFVEHLLPELPLLQSFCAMLAEGRVDYDPDSCRGVSLAAFSRAPEHAVACDPDGARRAA